MSCLLNRKLVGRLMGAGNGWPLFCAAFKG